MTEILVAVVVGFLVGVVAGIKSSVFALSAAAKQTGQLGFTQATISRVVHEAVGATWFEAAPEREVDVERMLRTADCILEDVRPDGLMVEGIQAWSKRPLR